MLGAKPRDTITFATIRVETPSLNPDDLVARFTEAAQGCADVLVYVVDFGTATPTEDDMLPINIETFTKEIT